MRFLKWIGALILVAMLGTPGHAQGVEDYPAKQVRIIVPFEAGGLADIFARILATELQRRLARPVIVENRPGAGGTIGASEAAASPPDGSTLLLLTTSDSIQEVLEKSRRYSLLRDFDSVASIYESELILVANKDLEANSVSELIALGKKRPNYLTYSSSGSGTSLHFAGELLQKLAGIVMMHVPYRVAANARVDLLRGDVKLMFLPAPNAQADVAEGKVKGLATTGLQRSLYLPDLPTMRAAGVEGFDVSLWAGIIAPKGTPPAILDRLHLEISTYLAAPEVKDQFVKRGAVPMVMTRAEFGRLMADDIAKWADLISSQGIKVEK